MQSVPKGERIFRALLVKCELTFGNYLLIMFQRKVVCVLFGSVGYIWSFNDLCTDESETLFVVPCCENSTELWWSAHHAHGTATGLLATYKRTAINLYCTAFTVPVGQHFPIQVNEKVVYVVCLLIRVVKRNDIFSNYQVHERILVFLNMIFHIWRMCGEIARRRSLLPDNGILFHLSADSHLRKTILLLLTHSYH